MWKNFISTDISKNLDVPFTMADATTLTEADMLVRMLKIILKLLQAADYNVDKAKGHRIYRRSR